VPGSVYNDLLNAGRMEDPYWRDNEMKALALMDEDYRYNTTFDVNAGRFETASASYCAARALTPLPTSF
jgi:beta-mannosidase